MSAIDPEIRRLSGSLWPYGDRQANVCPTVSRGMSEHFWRGQHCLLNTHIGAAY